MIAACRRECEWRACKDTAASCALAIVEGWNGRRVVEPDTESPQAATWLWPRPRPPPARPGPWNPSRLDPFRSSQPHPQAAI